MLDILDLEHRQKVYSLKKRYIPLAVAVGTMLFVAILSYLFTSGAKARVEPVKPVKKIIKIAIPEKNSTKEINQTSTPEIEERTILSPSMDFIQSMKNRQTQEIVVKVVAPQAPVVAKQTSAQIQPQAEVVPVVVEQPKTVVKPIQKQQESSSKVQISIERSQTGDDLNQVIKRFQTNQNPALSLFVAKKSYENGDYHQALNYALITNKLKSDMPDSWIIFAKSLVKLGRKDEALKTLKEYASFSGSTEAKQLMEDISTGRFK